MYYFMFFSSFLSIKEPIFNFSKYLPRYHYHHIYAGYSQIYVYLKQPMFLGYMVLQLCCIYILRKCTAILHVEMFPTSTFVLSAGCVRCPVWALSIVHFMIPRYVVQVFPE
jgi:hypothetical protein